MKTAIIGCKTIEHELTAAMARADCHFPVFWVESGLHNVPDTLRKAVQERIDLCGDYERILLAMGYCGNAVVGLMAGRGELVLPRADDCISILCGSQQQRLKYPNTYFFTEGWLRGEHTIWWEYEHTVRKYGEKKADRIFKIMLHNYQYCALLNTGCFDLTEADREVSEIARRLHLSYTVLPGTIDYLCQLLQGPWDPDRFLILPPHSQLERTLLHI